MLFLALIIGQLSYAIDPYTPLAYKGGFVSALDNNSYPETTPEYSNNFDAGDSYGYANEAASFQVTVDSVTQQSVITVEDAWTLASLIDANSFPIDRITGAPLNIRPVSEVLQIVSQLMKNPTQQAAAKEALHTMLEATEVALEFVKLKIAYEDEAYVGRQDLIMGLDLQKDDIQTQINRLNKMNPNNSYYSWIFGSGSTGKSPQGNANNLTPIRIDQNSSFINIPADRMATIIKHNDYKQKSNATVAANLLFQQCFIAQQQFKSENIIPINPKSPFIATDYMYANFPKIYNNKIDNLYPICSDILKLQDKNDRRSRLLQIRQAVQIALFIANKKSGYNAGNLFPQSVVSYLDGIVSELMRYDAYLNVLCKNPMYGATPRDMAKTEEWSTMSKVAAGIIIVGGIAAAVHYNDPNAIQNGINQVTQLYNGSGSTLNQASSLMNWWNGSPATTGAAPAVAIGPKAPEVKPAPAVPAPVENKEESISQKIKNMFSSNTPAPAAPVKKYNSEIIAEEESQAALAGNNASQAPIKPQTYFDKMLARNNNFVSDSADLGDYIQQKNADVAAEIIQDAKDLERVKGSSQFAALGGQALAKNSGQSFQQIAARETEQAKNKEVERKQVEAGAKGANQYVKEQERTLTQEQIKQQRLEMELAAAKAKFELASTKNPTAWFGTDAPAVADARKEMNALAKKKDEAYVAVRDQKELVSDAKKIAEEKATAISKAKADELLAKKAKEDAVRLAKIADQVTKERNDQKIADSEANVKKLEADLNLQEAALGQSGFGDWMQEKTDQLKEFVANKADDISNYQLPTMDDISNKANSVINYQLPRASADKAPYQMTGLEKIASMKDSVSNAINNAMTPSTPATYATQKYSSQNVGSAPVVATSAAPAKRYYSEMADDEQ